MFDYGQLERSNKALHDVRDVLDLVQRHEALLRVRTSWDAAWRDLSTHFLPTRFGEGASLGQPGRDGAPLLNDKLVDSTGVLAMRTMAAGLHGGMTSPARPWFRLSVEDQALSEAHGVREWMDEVAKRMRAIFHRSNFYNAVHTLYEELGTFGTAFMMEEADFAHGFRFIPFSAGEYCLDCNERQRVDVVFRRFHMTARQLLLQFGASALPDMVRQAAENPHSSSSRRTGQGEQWTVVHGVFPRKDARQGRLDAKNKPFASVYWLEGAAAGQSTHLGALAKPHILRESGYDEFPGFGVRWNTRGNAVYGRSPAMDVLPDCRMLQQMGITTLKAIHKAVDPPMNVTSALKSVGLDLTPGGVNYVEAAPGQPPQAATPLLQIRPEIQAARAAIQDVQRQIQQGLYNDLFRMLMSQNRSQITAREIAAKEEEKLILIGPVLERLHDELFIPLIDCTFNNMARLNMLPPCPPELAGQDIKVEFVSLLAQAQKLVSTASVDQLVGFVSNLGQVFPEALDVVDVDKVVDSYAEYLGVEVSMVRPLEDRQALRQQRAEAQAAAQQQMQQQQAMQGLQGVADTAQTLSQTPSSVTGGTALDAILGGIGNAGGAA